MNLSEFQLGLMVGGFVAFGLGFVFFVLFVVVCFAEAAHHGPLRCEHGLQSHEYDENGRLRCSDCEGD